MGQFLYAAVGHRKWLIKRFYSRPSMGTNTIFGFDLLSFPEIALPENHGIEPYLTSASELTCACSGGVRIESGKRAVNAAIL